MLSVQDLDLEKSLGEEGKGLGSCVIFHYCVHFSIVVLQFEDHNTMDNTSNTKAS